MSEDPRLQRMRDMLLPEIKSEEPRQWYYISVANTKFQGGYFLKAHGPTDAWRLLHALGWYTPNCSTETTGPIDEESMKKVPEDMRWRRLSKEEVESL